MKKEIKRQTLHLLVGIVALLILLLYGRDFAIAVIFMALVGGTLVINTRLLGMKSAIIEWAEQFEREDVLFLGWGLASYLAGMLISLTFLTDINQIAASIFILTIGDGFSTIIGCKGRIRLPYNKKKTFEGSTAFLLSSLPAYYFVGPAIIPLALIATIVESMPIPVDDNLTIPIVCTIFFLVV